MRCRETPQKSISVRLLSAGLLALSLISSAPLLTAVASVLSIPVWAAPTEIAPSDLEHAISDNLMRVREFAFIRKEAEKMGVRVYLFGGTAAAYAHYAKWNLRRTRGDSRYIESRFDFDYLNIFRSTQDLDIVVDGTPEQATRLEGLLHQHFKHVQGSKSAWEVRPLRHRLGDKEALLNNHEFLNQNSDSNSTGLVEVTTPPAGEHAVRDLRDWSADWISHRPRFFEDVRLNKLHFYYDPQRHRTTQRAQEGKNPEVFGAIRYVTKLFQFDADPDPAALAIVQKIIDDFDPKRDLQTAYAHGWIERNIPKLIQHAVNIERATQFAAQSGLRDKIATISDKDIGGTAGWWMNKEALRSSPLASGPERTAADLKLTVVAHETSNYLAYESITRAPTGDPNVLISRPDMPWEVASGGPGFYTAVGRKGAKHTGLTIRFEVDPKARLGVDFLIHGQAPAVGSPVHEGEHIIWLNKKALRVIPESLNLGPVEYFKFLAREDSLSSDDRGIMERLEKRIGHQIGGLNPAETAQILAMGNKILEKEVSSSSSFLSEFFKIPAARALIDAEAIHRQLFKWRLGKLKFSTAYLWLHSDIPKTDIKRFKRGFDQITRDRSFVEVFASKILPTWNPNEGVEQIQYTLMRLAEKHSSELVRHVFTRSQFRREEFLRTMVDHLPGNRDGNRLAEQLARNAFSQPDANHYPDLILKLLVKAEKRHDMASIWSHAGAMTPTNPAALADINALKGAMTPKGESKDPMNSWLVHEIAENSGSESRRKQLLAAIHPGSLTDLLADPAQFWDKVKLASRVQDGIKTPERPGLRACLIRGFHALTNLGQR